MNNPTIATAADYADAMLTARRAKNWLFVILLLLLLAQLAGFFAVRYTAWLAPTKPVDPAVAAAAAGAAAVGVPAVAVPDATTQPAISATASLGDKPAVPGVVPPEQRKGIDAVRYATAATTFLGIVLAIVLGLVLLLIVKIMLVGRLIGVARVTNGYIWCLLLTVLLFPWQAFFNSVDYATATPGQTAAMVRNPAFQVPGVLYTWDELRYDARFGIDAPADVPQKVLKWARFVGFPVVAMLLLLVVQSNSSRGLRLALGEAEADMAHDDGPQPV